MVLLGRCTDRDAKFTLIQSANHQNYRISWRSRVSTYAGIVLGVNFSLLINTVDLLIAGEDDEKDCRNYFCHVLTLARAPVRFELCDDTNDGLPSSLTANTD